MSNVDRSYASLYLPGIRCFFVDQFHQSLLDFRARLSFGTIRDGVAVVDWDLRIRGHIVVWNTIVDNTAGDFIIVLSEGTVTTLTRDIGFSDQVRLDTTERSCKRIRSLA
jgi:hypothetical protein